MTDPREWPRMVDRSLYEAPSNPSASPTDHEKIEERMCGAAPQTADLGGVYMGEEVYAEVERMLRDAAERAWRAGQKSASETCGSEYSHTTEPLPADFPLLP